MFDTAIASRKNQNIDAIMDFNIRDDTIQLKKAVFRELKAGVLKKDAFWIGAKAHDKSDRIVYGGKKGLLYYDADGKGKGAAIEFATITKKLKSMSYHDFMVV